MVIDDFVDPNYRVKKVSSTKLPKPLLPKIAPRPARPDLAPLVSALDRVLSLEHPDCVFTPPSSHRSSTHDSSSSLSSDSSGVSTPTLGSHVEVYVA